jgi:signal transduction histidine kinase/ActR/RegA family two-component response regulator
MPGFPQEKPGIRSTARGGRLYHRPMAEPHPPDLPRSLVLLALAALLPIILFAAFSAAQSLRQQRDALERDLQAHAQRLSQQVDREIEAQLGLVRSLARLPLFDEPVDPQRFAETAQRIQAVQPLWRLLTVIDRQGIRLADSLGSPPQPVVEPASLPRVFATGEATIGDVATGPGGVPALPVRAPIVRDGEIRYVLTAAIRTDSISDLLLQTQLPAEWIAAVLDREGRIVARSRGSPGLVGGRASEAAQAALRRGGEGLYSGRSLEGIETVATYHVSPATGWSIHVGLPREKFEAPLQRSALLSAAGGGASLALAALFGWLLLRETRARRRKRLAFEQAQRMESLGRLTGGIAHDFNNLLTVVLGNLEIIELRHRGAGLERPVQAIRRAADRGAQLTRELLAFARSGNAQPSLVDINERVRGFLGMLRQSLPQEVTIDLDLQDHLPLISVDPVHLDLALLNIAVNARDAMPGGGTLRIATSRAALPGRPGSSALMLAMSDTGLGVPEEVLPHVFEPFFTTKEMGKGTGLGLTQVYGFAHHAGGSVEIASKVGRGTIVTLYLPAAAASLGDAPDSFVDAEPQPGGSTLLLVDDNDEVRGVIADYLRESGYVVMEAAGGDAALAVIEDSPVDLLISDLVMPGALDGIGLAREAQRRRPDLKILLISGYSDSAAEARKLGLAILGKPFKLGDLADAIREAGGEAQRA